MMSHGGGAGLRVLHCPEMVGGHPQGLARGECALGLKSRSVVFRSSKFEYPTDETLWRHDDSLITREWKRWGLLGRALRHFDVVHFNFGRTLAPEVTSGGRGWKARLRNWCAGLLEMRDLDLLRRAGKVIAFTFQGDDARQGDVFRRYASFRLEDELAPGYYDPTADAHKRWRIARIARGADLIYALNPDLLRVLPAGAKFLPYASVDPRAWAVPQASGDSMRPPLVLHAPTHRGIKGTRHVLEAVQRLQAEGVPFRFQLLEGLTWTEARAAFAHVDLLIDQLFIGWYGGLAVELMALGKPVICFIRPEDERYTPPDLWRDLPIIQASAQTLYGVLKEWLTTRCRELVDKGRQSRQFVERWHDPRIIAAGVVADYQSVLAARKKSHQSA